MQNRENNMKTKIALCLLAVISFGVAFAQTQAAGVTAEKAVTAAEEQWTQSERTNNPDLAAPLLADKLIYIDTDGTISTRTKFLADAKVTKFTSVDIENLHITVFGNTAV